MNIIEWKPSHHPPPSQKMRKRYITFIELMLTVEKLGIEILTEMWSLPHFFVTVRQSCSEVLKKCLQNFSRLVDILSVSFSN